MNNRNVLKILSLFFILLMSVIPSKIYAKDGVKVVVIDAGHGGKDPGTLARNRNLYNEKVITLKVAMRLGRMIKEKCKDVKVIYTRTSDRYISLNRRAQIANEANADLFISIHVDAVRNKKIHGSTVYVLGLHRSEDNLKVAMRENAVILQEEDYKTKYAGFNPRDPESYIIFSLMQNQYLDNSLMMANLVKDSLHTTTGKYTKGVKQAGFYVLREVAMPSILVETGYITNYSDAKFLCSLQGQKKTANAIFKAFLSYKNYVENNTINLAEAVVPYEDEVVEENPVSTEETNEVTPTVEEKATPEIISQKKSVVENPVTPKEEKTVEPKITQDKESLVKAKVEKEMDSKESLLGEDESYYSIQMLYSVSEKSVEDLPFSKLKEAVTVYKDGGAYRYIYGKTKSYVGAQRLLKKAKVYAKDAYIIGIHKGKKVDRKVVSDILGQ